MKDLIINEDLIQNKIYNIRWNQVMLDRDLAKLYWVETRVLKQAVKRNIKRFPKDFLFQLTENEINLMVSQFVIPSKQHLWWSKPYAFTEQWVSMLSSILKSDFAIEISIKIIRSFINIKKILLSNASLFQRIDNLELKLLDHDENFNKIFKSLKSEIPIQWIFHNWQIYDAYKFINDLFKSSKKEIVIIDNYLDDSVLTLLSKYPKLNFIIITKNITKHLQLDIKKYKFQYNNLEIKKSNNFHDRFILLDNKEAYHLWSSLKDLWKKIFGFNKIDIELLVNNI